jgi:hypothetical protein
MANINRVRKYTDALGYKPTGGPSSVGVEYSSDRSALALSTTNTTTNIQYIDGIKFDSFMLTSSLVTTNVFIAPTALEVLSIKYVGVALSTDLNVSLYKCTSTTAPGSGTLLHTGAVYGTTAINTVTTLTLTSSTATLTLAVGDRVGAAGVTTTAASTLVTLTYKRV